MAIVQRKVGVQIAWITGGLLFGTTAIGIVCKKSTGKLHTINTTVYNYPDSSNSKINTTPVRPKIADSLQSAARPVHNNAVKFASKNTIHTHRKIREKEIMSDMNRYFPDRTISVEFIAFDKTDAEVTAVKNRISAILRKNGYKNIQEKFRLKTGAVVPEKIVLDTVPGKHSICFAIPPAK
jgi:hypothetical protein